MSSRYPNNAMSSRVDNPKYSKNRDSTLTSSQESINSNGFSYEKRDSFSANDSANDNDIERCITIGKMANVPIIRETDETTGSPHHTPNHTEHSASNAVSTPTSLSISDDRQVTPRNKGSSERKHSDRSSSEYHDPSPDKLDGSGDNLTPSVSLTVPGGYDTKSVSSHGSTEGSFDQSLDSLMVKLGDKSGDRSDLLTSMEISGRSSIADSGSKSGTEQDGKKKKKSWYTVLNPTYKSRMIEFKKLFKDVPKGERLMVDYSCAYQKDILVQGRMYLTQNFVCFYANIFTWETNVMIPCNEIIAVTKEKTARVIPNAIQITTQKDKYFFTSFTSRDKAFLMLFRVWQNNLLDQQMSSKELWHWVHYSYGDELGLTLSDGDYADTTNLDDSQQEKENIHPRRRRVSKKHDVAREDAEPMENHTSPASELTHTLTRDLHPSPHSSTASLDTSSIVPTTHTRAVIDGDSSGADSPGEVVCSNHDHLDKVYLNDTFELPVDKVFEFLFSDSRFFCDFCASRKTFNLSLPDWQPEPNSDGDREREIRYTLTLSASIGPKHSPSYEKQIYHAESQPGFIYVVDAHCYNGGIPYADTFYVTNRYCLTRVTRNSCRVRVSSELKFTKNIWSLVKNMIDKNARHGLTDYYQSLESHLRREAMKYETSSPSRGGLKKPARRRRKATEHSSGETDRLTEPPTPTRSRTDGAFGISAENLVRLLCFVLVSLFVFNAYLFYKLFYLETVTQSLHYTTFTHDSLEQFTKHTQSPEEWLTLLKRQEQLHQMEVDKWRDVLGGAVVVLDHIKITLAGLKEMLNQRNSDPIFRSTPRQEQPQHDET